MQPLTFLLAMSIMLSPVVGHSSAGIYIAESASGDGSGYGCSNARSVTWLNDAASWGSERGQIAPGTTVHLCGSIDAHLTLRGSGTVREPITILFEHGASLTHNGCQDAFILMSDLNYIVIDGNKDGVIQNKGCGTHGIRAAGRAIIAMNCTGCEIRNLTIANLYVHEGPGDEIDATQSNCIMYSGANFLVHHNVMHDVGWCLYLNGTGIGNRIYDNDIFNIDHGIAFTPSCCNAPAGPLYIYNNHIHDYANWDTATNAYHHDGLHCFTVPYPYPTSPGRPIAGAEIAGLWIYNNVFDGNLGGNATGHIFLEPGVQTDGSATPCLNSNSQVHIFGNLLLGATDTGAVDLGRPSSDPLLIPVDFYNNTILGSSASDHRAVVFENVRSANILNNIVGGANKLWDGVPFLNLDYNGYVNCSARISYNCWPVANWSNRFDTWRQDCRCDQHGIDAQENSGGVNQESGKLDEASVMAGMGEELIFSVPEWPADQRAALSVDLLGNRRGSGRWDIGALSAETRVRTRQILHGLRPRCRRSTTTPG